MLGNKVVCARYLFNGYDLTFQNLIPMKTTETFCLFALFIFPITFHLQAQENVWASPEWFDVRKQTGDRYETLEPVSDAVAIVRRDGRFGMINLQGNELAPPIHSQIYRANDEALIVQQDGKSGAFSTRGVWIVPVDFAEVKTFPVAGGSVACRRDSLFAIFDNHGKQRTPFQYRDVKEIVPGKIVARTGKVAWGGWDSNGKLLIPERYDDLTALPGGFWQACLLEQCALLGPDGTPRTAFQYQRIIGFPEGHYLASVAASQKGNFYWFDASGKRLSDAIATYYSAPKREGLYLPRWPEGSILLPWEGDPVPLRENNAIKPQVGVPAGWTLLSETGSEGDETFGWLDSGTGWRMEPIYQGVVFQNGYILAAGYEKTEVYDRHNRLIRTWPFSTDLVAGAQAWIFHNYAGTGLCDTAFRTILPARETTIIPEPWGGFADRSNDKISVYDPAGKPIFKEPVDWAGQDRQNGQKLIFSRNKKLGIADFNGKTILPPTYDRIEACYFDGNYVATQNNRLGLLDHQGKLLLPFEYDRIESKHGGVIQVTKNGKTGLADARDGRLIMPVVYDELTPFGRRGVQVRHDGRRDIYDYNGKVLVQNLTDKITVLTAGQLICSAGKWGIMDDQFRPIEPFQYDALYFRDGILTARQGLTIKRWLIRDDRLIPTALEKVRYMGEWAQSPYWALKEGKWGLYNRNDQKIVEHEHDQVAEVKHGGLLAVLRRGRQAVVRTVELKTVARFDADSLLDCRQAFIRYQLNGQSWLRNLFTGESKPLKADDWQVYPLDELLAVRINQRVQLFSANLQPAFPGDLDDFPLLSETYCGMLTALQNGRHGLLRMDGSLVLPFEYDRISNESESMYMPFYDLNKGHKRGFYHCQTQRLLPAIYDHWSFVDTTGFILAGSEGKMALFSPEIKQLTGFDLETAEPYGAGLFLLTKANWIYALIDRQGKAVIPGNLTHVTRQDKFLKARRNDKTGLIGPKGQVVIDFQYDDVDELGPHAFRVSIYQNNALFQQRLFDHQGKEISRQRYSRIEMLTDSSFFVWDSEERQGIVDLDGRTILPLDMRYILCWRGLCAVKQGDKWGLIKVDGTPMLPYDYDFIDAGDDGPLVVGKLGRYGYFDINGRWLTGLEYDYADLFSNGRAAVRKNGKWGFLNVSGKELIPLRFDYAENFRYNTPETVVLLDGRYMLIDTAGIVTRAFPYEQPRASEFFHRRLEHENKAGKGTVLKDYSGRILLQKAEFRFMQVKGGLIVYAKDSHDECTYPPYGLMNYAGTPIGQAVYTHLSADHLGVCYMIPAIRDKHWGFLHGRGHEVIPFEYDRVWNVYEPFKNGDWEGGVHLAGKSWMVNRFGKWVREQ